MRRKDVKVGDWLELSLTTSETYNLYLGLGKRYELYNEIGIPAGQTTFVQVDKTYSNLLSILHDDPSTARMIAKKENYALIKELLKLITQSDSLDALEETLRGLEVGNLEQLSSSLSLEQLERASQEIRANLDNSAEEYWQQSVFGKYHWILSQVFSAPCTIIESKAYVGGKSIGNTGGNVCDFIYQNKLSKNVALIEIKTPCSQILGGTYRATYSLSEEMSGAVNQVLNYRDHLVKSYYQLSDCADNSFNAFSPKCVVVIGKMADLANRGMISAFENYRNSLNGITVITYDELLQKIDDLIAVLKSDSTNEVDSSTEECPF
jgi:hypothetical protein